MILDMDGTEGSGGFLAGKLFSAVNSSPRKATLSACPPSLEMINLYNAPHFFNACFDDFGDA